MPGIDCPSCCCATASSTPVARPGPLPTRPGCGVSGSLCRSATPDHLRVRLRGRADRQGPSRPARRRRSPRWPRDCEFTPLVRRLGCLRGVCTLTAFALAVEIGDWSPVHRQHHRLLRRPGPLRSTPRANPGSRARSPRPATPTSVGFSSRPPGTTAPATVPGMTMRYRWELATPAARARGHAGQPTSAPPLGPLPRPPQTPRGRQRRHRPRTRRLVLVPGGPRRLAPPRAGFVDHGRWQAARGATRDTTMSSQPLTVGDARS